MAPQAHLKWQKSHSKRRPDTGSEKHDDKVVKTNKAFVWEGNKNHIFFRPPKSDEHYFKNTTKITLNRRKGISASTFENASKTVAEKSPERPNKTSGKQSRSHVKSMKIRTWTPRVFRILTFRSTEVPGYHPPPKIDEHRRKSMQILL